jgi:benzoyl-CoA reductase/2-hydroxyglutaryl-CoA dehydratase subunit BcrC/BadD/HgdB
MVGLTCICEGLSKSSVAITEQIKIPLFLIDVPRAIQITPEGEIDGEKIQYQVEYLRIQYGELIKFLEEQTGHRFNEERLIVTCQLLNQALELWDEISELRKAIPSPMSAIDEIFFLPVLRYFLGTKEAVTILQWLRDEVAERVKNSQGTIATERHRLLLLSGPAWCYDMDILHYFEELGAVLVKIDLDILWAKGRLDPEMPRKSWAKNMILNYSTIDSLPAHIAYIKKLVRNYQVDGMVILSHWGCRVMGGQHLAIKEAIYQRFGIPSLILDGDICDSRHRASREHDLYKIEEFIEILE